MKNKICVVSGSRSDYGLLVPLLRKIQSDGFFRLQILVTGTHLSSDFGSTYRFIENDGFKISGRVKLFLSDDSKFGIARSTGLGMAGFSDTLKKLKPDLVVVLGDRFEIFSAAATAFFLKIPIAHIHGGELTEGSLDDGLRHAITKLSVLHFCSNHEYKKRVIQMGEDPKSVFDVGAIGIDNIRSLRLLDKQALERELGPIFGQKTVLVTFYPATIKDDSAEFEFNQLLSALNKLKEVKIIFTKPGADIGAKIISRLIDRYVSLHPNKAVAFVNLGQLRYLSVMKAVDAVVGNSSSGIIEAPAFSKPVVNVGNRQKGRIAAESVIHCAALYDDILKALKRALSEEFRILSTKVKNPYGNGYAAERIYKILKGRLKSGIEINKTFYDLYK